MASAVATSWDQPLVTTISTANATDAVQLPRDMPPTLDSVMLPNTDSAPSSCAQYGGTANLRVCCSNLCRNLGERGAACGGTRCSRRSGPGPKLCCTNDIIRAGKFCSAATAAPCLLPSKAVDQATPIDVSTASIESSARCMHYVQSLQRGLSWHHSKDRKGRSTVDFDFKPNDLGFKKFNSQEVAELLHGHRFLLVGNSMMNRLTQSLVILLRCCYDAPPIPNNDERHWFDMQTVPGWIGHGSYFYPHPEIGPEIDLSKPLGAADDYTTQGLDFRQQLLQCAKQAVAPLPPPGIHFKKDTSLSQGDWKTYRDSPGALRGLNCDLLQGSPRAAQARGEGREGRTEESVAEATVIAFYYTGTPQYTMQAFLLDRLSRPPVADEETGELQYKSAQDDVDVIVIQAPYEPRNETFAFRALVGRIKKVIAYDAARGLSTNKQWFIYGRTWITMDSKTKRQQIHDGLDELDRAQIAAEVGAYYVPLNIGEMKGVEYHGLEHEDSNHWHFKDVGQHYVTQVFLNMLAASRSCT